jgi:hypothetical protein
VCYRSEVHGYKAWRCEQERIYVITRRERFDHFACARVNFNLHTYFLLYSLLVHTREHDIPTRIGLSNQELGIPP